jgi:hypothetical protein
MMMVSVKLCVALGLTLFEAVIVSGYMPWVTAAGAPLNTPEEEKDIPDGSAPVSEKVGVGYPLAVIVNEPALPMVNWAVDELTIDGA